MVAWQQQVYYQQQVAAAEALSPKSKKQHIGGGCKDGFALDQCKACAAVTQQRRLLWMPPIATRPHPNCLSRRAKA